MSEDNKELYEYNLRHYQFYGIVFLDAFLSFVYIEFTLKSYNRNNKLKTKKHSLSDKQTGFATGTDDYMTKPVNFDELRWLIDALLRRSNIASERTIRIKETVIEETKLTISKGNVSIELPPKNFAF